MENTPMIVGGGILAIIVGVIVFKKKSTQAAQENSAPITTSDIGYFSGVIPQSNSFVSGSATPSDESNSGSTDTAGGFDIRNLLTNAIVGQTQNAALQIVSNKHISDSAILAGINLGSAGGTATVSHSSTGSILNVQMVTPIAPVNVTPIRVAQIQAPPITPIYSPPIHQSSPLLTPQSFNTSTAIPFYLRNPNYVEPEAGRAYESYMSSYV